MRASFEYAGQTYEVEAEIVPAEATTHTNPGHPAHLEDAQIWTIGPDGGDIEVDESDMPPRWQEMFLTAVREGQW